MVDEVEDLDLPIPHGFSVESLNDGDGLNKPCLAPVEIEHGVREGCYGDLVHGTKAETSTHR